MGSALSLASLTAAAVSNFCSSLRYAENSARAARATRRIHGATYCEWPQFQRAANRQGRSASEYVSCRSATTVQSGNASGFAVEYKHGSGQASAFTCRSTSQAWNTIRQAGGIDQVARSKGGNNFARAHAGGAGFSGANSDARERRDWRAL